jgi:gamma-glutamyltranspeptidase/glutathione hydrolase
MSHVPHFDWTLPYSSRRSPLLARNVVATSQPLAAQAGLRMLLAGGNAADAAVATAIALTVVEPVMNGIGSDAFALIWDGTALYGLNASGRSPAAWTPDRFVGRYAMPTEGWGCVTVPGAVSAWAALSARFGRLPFHALCQPAIEYARDGFLVSPTVSRQWQAQVTRLQNETGFAAAFLRNGRAPLPGERFQLPDHASTLEDIAATQGESFYRGALSAAIASCANGEGLTADDLAAHQAEWVEPASQSYRGYGVHEIPPNGQGLSALIALGILEHTDLASHPPDSPDSMHLQIEAMKLGFADVYRHVSDPATMQVRWQELLDPTYLKARARLIDPSRATQPVAGLAPSGTVYLTAADASGMMVSFIQSNYMGFGSGIVVPGTGISLHNRGAGFSLQAGHPNEVGPRKRPFHTIIPAFMTRDGQPIMSFGVMGADMQPQGHVQMVTRVVDYKQNPQAAADAPRWKIALDGSLLLEATVPEATARTLAGRGHIVHIASSDSTEFGAAQLIYKLDEGYAAGSEPRRDGQAVGY